MAEAFVYCWTDHRFGKLYVGSHKGQIDDGYVSSSNYLLKEFFQRPGDFTRQIIAEGSDENIRKLEMIILRSVDAANSDDFYNKSNGFRFGIRGPKSLEHKRKVSETLKKRGIRPPPRKGLKDTPEVIAKRVASMQKHRDDPEYHRKLSEAAKRDWSRRKALDK